MLEFNTALKHDVIVIELEGALDSHSAADFRSWFQEKLTAGYRAFALDCLCLEYVSSSGITSLIDLQNTVAAQNGKVVLYQLSSETRQLIKFLNLDKKLNLVSEYDDAISALTGYKRIIETPVIAPEVHEGIDAMVGADEMVMEEGLEGRTGLQPVAAPARPAAPVPAQEPVPIPAPAIAATAPPTIMSVQPEPVAPADSEVREIRIDAIAQRLITCPNCKNVLRVKQAGDYLCPSCRFRFAYKGAA